MASPPMSAATDGSGKLENVLADGVTLEDYRHPDWAVTAGAGDYVHALVTACFRLKFTPA